MNFSRHVITLLWLVCAFTGYAQNLIGNNSFESNGQGLCTGWYDDCGNEITPLCQGTVSFGCNSANWGAQLFQDAPPNGGQWCMRLKANGSGNSGLVRTTLAGQFLGVYELKVWMRIHSLGARADASITYKAGEFYTGQKGSVSYSANWALVTVTDTIQTLSDTIIIGVASTETVPGGGNVAYADMVQFTMKQNWLSTIDVSETPVTIYNTEPIVIQVPIIEGKDYRFNLCNMQGQVVNRNEPMPNGCVQLPTGALPAGVYFYSITYNGQAVATGKIPVTK